MATDDAAYVMGHSERELLRLQIQAQVLQPITRRALQRAGLRTGARVLDVGCGAGDTTMLAAEIVGSLGHVFGVDRNETALASARKRAATSDIKNVTFVQCPLEDFGREELFDAVIARYVLVHQPDPADCLRHMARLVKPDGLLLCHEVSFRFASVSFPAVLLWEFAVNELVTAFRAASPSHDAADLLARYFADAGLAAPELMCEIPITVGRNSALCSWIVETLSTLTPFVKPDRLSLIDIDTLEQRMRRALAEADAQVEAPAQVIGWVRIP